MTNSNKYISHLFDGCGKKKVEINAIVVFLAIAKLLTFLIVNNLLWHINCNGHRYKSRVKYTNKT